MLLIARAVFFFMLILAFVYFRDGVIKTAAETLDLRMTSIHSACLLISGIAMWRTARSSIAMLFGGTFLLGQGIEYVRMLRPASP